MKLVANKNAHVDPNDVPLSTLIEQNNDVIDVNFIARNNFNNAYRAISILDCFSKIPLIIMVILIIIIVCPLI